MAITPVKPADPLDLKRLAGQPTLGGPGKVLSSNAEAVAGPVFVSRISGRVRGHGKGIPAVRAEGSESGLQKNRVAPIDHECG